MLWQAATAASELKCPYDDVPLYRVVKQVRLRRILKVNSVLYIVLKPADEISFFVRLNCMGGTRIFEVEGSEGARRRA